MAVSDTARAVKLWQAAVRKVEELPATVPSADLAQDQDAAPLAPVDDVLPTVDEFLELPRLYASTWNKLVVDLKIPLHLGQAAANTAHSLAPKATAAVSAIGSLILKAQADNYLQLEAPSALSRQLGQQLKQSGFLAALPKLLEAAATALADTQHNSDVLAAVPYTEDPRRSSTKAGRSAAVRHVLCMQELAVKLLVAVTSCVYFWPQQWDRDAVAAPALHLCMVTMQHCSICADLITPTASGTAAAAPIALEQLAATAYTAGQAVFTAWDPEQLDEDDPDVSALECPDAMRAICCMLMVPIVCPQQYYTETQQLINNLEARTKNAAKIRPDMTASNSSSVQAWQHACGHASELSELQQQTLQALGCSSRLFMYLAGSVLTSVMNANTILGGANVYTMLARHDAPLANLDRPAEVRKLAAKLEGLQKGATPPGTSPLLRCAPLLWLMPAVLLEWAGKQPARGAHFAWQNYMFSTLFWPSVEKVLEQFDWWADAESTFYDAAGGDTGRLEQQQAMLNAMRSLLSGAPMAAIVPESHQNLSPEQLRQANLNRRMYESASAAADENRNAWTPPAACFAQLLLQVGGTAVRMLACMQAEADPGPAGSSSGTRSNPVSAKPSSSSSSTSGCKKRRNRKSSSKYGDIVPISGDTEQFILSKALQRFSQGTVAMLTIAYRLLWYFVNKGGLAARRDPMIGLERYGMIADPDRVGVDPGELDEHEQANLAVLCAALQETLPQLASLVDATMRTPVQEEASQYTQLAVGSNFLHALQVPGVFVAAGLQPGSPALKPLASLTATLLKVVAAAQASPQESRNIVVAAHALRTVVCFDCLLLEIACNSSSTSGGGSGRGGGSSRGSGRLISDAVIDVLTGSKAVTDKVNRWRNEDLTTISTACKPASSSDSSSGSSSSGRDGDGSGSIDAVLMVPWLVGLGRCYLGYVGTMQVLATVGLQQRQGLLRELDIIGGALQGVGAVLPGWLQSASVSAQFATPGYVTAAVPELFKSVSKAQSQVAQKKAGPEALAQSAQGLGLALSSLPFGSACNNPLCRELGQLSEQQLVMGSARKCSGCRVARYCCKACQVAHWKQHKPACKAIAAATAPTASA